MFDWHVFGLISIIVNITLVLLLFFRSALNDILKDWWIDRKEKKEAAIQRLIEFKTNFSILQVQSLLLIFTLAKKQVSLIMGQAADQYIEDAYQNNLNNYSETGSSITKFLDLLPADLKTCYSNYEKEFTEIIRNIMHGQVAKEGVLPVSLHEIH